MHRFRNRILQLFYRPVRPRLFSPQAMASLDDLEKAIEKKITPLLKDLWF
jgi:hypothetical protein